MNTTTTLTSPGTSPVPPRAESRATSAPTAAPDGAPDPEPRRAPAPVPVRVAVVIGSNREGRFGPVVAGWLLSRLRERADLDVDVLDLAAADLPTAISSRPSPEVAAELANVSPKLAGADAFIVLTPEYNHSYPASLKSLIDWHHAEWQAKPVALVSYGGVSGGLRAVEHLRQVFAELHAVSVRDTVSFHNAGSHFDEEGRHRDPAAADAAAERMVDQLVWWATALRAAKEVRPYGG
ncbi:NADPH-dependent FMN reductase [Streptomyces sp. TS71-3]|uniref:NADPH-dependent FMN reductase n=1 Tax=Streptomyces sp. TS71-3 TaxID=2733862 RepID=UPI001B105537|nr:NAD(P)H-dependent oxidoreductase [Streptomyces sp. TS71-3]GHJ37753.1 FMN reductase [Streptomyces sp. TS71-3]